MCTQQHVTMLLACIDIDDEHVHSIRSTILALYASMTSDNIVRMKVCPKVELILYAICQAKRHTNNRRFSIVDTN